MNWVFFGLLSFIPLGILLFQSNIDMAAIYFIGLLIGSVVGMQMQEGAMEQ